MLWSPFWRPMRVCAPFRSNTSTCAVVLDLSLAAAHSDQLLRDHSRQLRFANSSILVPGGCELPRSRLHDDDTTADLINLGRTSIAYFFFSAQNRHSLTEVGIRSTCCTAQAYPIGKKKEEPGQTA